MSTSWFRPCQVSAALPDGCFREVTWPGEPFQLLSSFNPSNFYLPLVQSLAHLLTFTSLVRLSPGHNCFSFAFAFLGDKLEPIA